MNIDTTSKQTMQESICRLFGIDIKQLEDVLKQAFRYCQKDKNHYVDGDLQREFFQEYIQNNVKEEIHEIHFFHLTRRLNGDDSNACYNLVRLMSQSFAINKFLKKYHFTFEVVNSKVLTYFKDKEISNDKIYDFKNHIEGFIFKEHLVKNEYYAMLQEAPEFIVNLAYATLQFEMIEEYINNSEYYCYEYSLPIDMIVFDEEEELSYTKKQQYIIEIVLERLYDYQYERQSSNDIENVLLRVVDQDIPGKYFITKTKL